MLYNKVNSYIKSSVFYILGNGVGQGLMLLSTIVFTRIMTKEGYGQYSTYYSFVSIMTSIIGANLSSAINNAYIDYKRKAREFRSSVLLLATIIMTCIAVLAIVGNYLFGNPFSYLLLIMAIMHSFGFFVITYYNNSATMENKYIKKGILLMLPNILQIAFSICFILMFPKNELNARVIGSTLGVGLCAAFVYVFMIKEHERLINTEYWKYGLKISVPLVFSSISFQLMSQCDNIMITAFKGAEETAVYAFVYYIGFIIVAVIQALNPVLQAWLFRTLDSKNTSKVKIVQKWYLVLFFVIALMLFMTAPEIIKIMGPESYWEFHYVGPFIGASYLMVMYSFYSMVIAFHKKNVFNAIAVAFVALINVIFNYVFIPMFGGIAAAIVSASSYFILFIVLMILGGKMEPGLYAKKYFGIFFFFVIVAIAVFELIYNNTFLRYSVFILAIIVCSVYALKKRDEIISISK